MSGISCINKLFVFFWDGKKKRPVVEKLKILQCNIFVIYTYRPSLLSSRKPQELEGKI